MNDSKIKMLTRQDIPCWYDLRLDVYNPPVPTLIVSVHEDMLAQWRVFPQKNLTLPFELDRTKFYTGVDKSFGYEGALVRSGGAVEGFVDFSLEVPKIFVNTDEKCTECKGKGKQRSEKCLFCEGLGKKQRRNEPEAYAKAVSLQVFLWQLLFPPEKDTKARYRQILTVGTTAIPESHGAHVSGEFSPVFVKHLLAQLNTETSFPSVADVMRGVYYHTLDRQIEDDGAFQEFRAVTYQGRLTLDCPGSAAGLHPCHNVNVKEGEGYKFTSHNMDSLPQQFAILAGLGRMVVDSYGYR